VNDSAVTAPASRPAERVAGTPYSAPMPSGVQQPQVLPSPVVSRPIQPAQPSMAYSKTIVPATTLMNVQQPVPMTNTGVQQTQYVAPPTGTSPSSAVVPAGAPQPRSPPPTVGVDPRLWAAQA